MKYFRTDENGDGTVYGWTGKLDGDRPVWRGGRAHLVANGVGFRRKRSGGRRDLHLNAEWSLLPPKQHRFGIGVAVKFGAGGADLDLALTIHASALGNLWLSSEGLLPDRFLVPGYESMVTELRFCHDHVIWQAWHPRNSHKTGTPWWRYTYLTWEHLFLGRNKVDREVIESGTCVVPMPERSYNATYTIERFTRRWSDRLGRFRPPVVLYRTDITPLDPIPVPGKGENSWDCGDDAIYGTSIGGRSVEKAIGAMVESALSTRRRHGGQQMSVPASPNGSQP